MLHQKSDDTEHSGMTTNEKGSGSYFNLQSEVSLKCQTVWGRLTHSLAHKINRELLWYNHINYTTLNVIF